PPSHAWLLQPQPPGSVYRRVSLPQSGPQVLGMALNCPESVGFAQNSNVRFGSEADLTPPVRRGPLHSKRGHTWEGYDRSRHGLGDVGAGDEPRAGLDRDRVAARAHARGIAPGLAGADIELPAVPGAADDLARARIAIVARAVGLDQA